MKHLIATALVFMNFLNVSYGSDSYYLYEIRENLTIVYIASFDSDSAQNIAHCELHKQALEEAIFPGSKFICLTEKPTEF